MRSGILIGLAAMSGVAPAPALAQSTLTGTHVTCTSDGLAGVPAGRRVVKSFALVDGRLVHARTSYGVYLAATTLTGSGAFPFSGASLTGRTMFWPQTGELEADLLRLAIDFRAPIGASMGSVKVRYAMNGVVIHESNRPTVMGEPGTGDSRGAEVTLTHNLPGNVLKDRQGTLEVLVLSSRWPEPIFRATFPLDDIGPTEWQRTTAARRDMDPSRVRRGGKLPSQCISFTPTYEFGEEEF